MKHALGFERNVLRPLVPPVNASLGHAKKPMNGIVRLQYRCTPVSLSFNLSTSWHSTSSDIPLM